MQAMTALGLGAAQSRGHGRWLPPCCLLMLVSCIGCLGPIAMRETRMQYNESYRRTTDEEWLLNIIRLRYADTLSFMSIAAVTSQHELSSVARVNGGRQGIQDNLLGAFDLSYRDLPTLSYLPESGSAWARALTTPISLELLALLRGRKLESQLVVIASSLNSLRNAHAAESVYPSTPDSNEEFRYAAQMLASLAQAGDVEVIRQTREFDVSEEIPANEVSAANLLQAVQDGFVYRKTPDGDHYVLKQKATKLMLRVNENARQSMEFQEAARVLGLDPLRSEYYFYPQSERPEADTDSRIRAGKAITLTTRSLMEIMIFLSKGVAVPPEHIACGLAPSVPGPDGCAWDWTQLTHDVFQVQFSKCRPKTAAVAVRYQGYWFYIDQRDWATKSTLQRLILLYNLQMREAERAGPLLTLPVGF